jgi:hypothetical protein
MIDQAFNIARKILGSPDGYCFDNKFCVKIHGHTNISIDNQQDCVKIRFSNNRPILIIRKVLKLSLGVSGVDLREDGGTLIVDNFPDIPFKYEWIDNDQ